MKKTFPFSSLIKKLFIFIYFLRSQQGKVGHPHQPSFQITTHGQIASERGVWSDSAF
jgi:hypothetical protein